ncbi:MAG: hypothetical protein JAY88_12395 [Candidatus Thiodiazotropha lotti]|nr:hypothetical protein [Candidatus Thiodiazotropha lotti]MCW4187864.1 hypothetical protein [Candidatus Thiodiazotropha lotti]
MNTKNLITTSMLLIALTSTGANAGGLFGDLIEGVCGGCGAGRALDQVHAGMGRPLDYAGANAVNTVAPGVGTLWLAQDHLKRRYNNIQHYQPYSNAYGHGRPVYRR